jgi:CRP-like cAMP-binding protein
VLPQVENKGGRASAKVGKTHKNRRMVLDAQTKEILSSGGVYVSSMSRLAEIKMDPSSSTATSRAERGGMHGDLDLVEKSSRGTIMVDVRELYRGCHFGEISLINKVPRSASIVSGSQCQLLVMSKIDFFRVFDKRAIQRFSSIGQEVGYVGDEELIEDMLRRESGWEEYKQKVLAESMFGNIFANNKHHFSQIAGQAKDIQSPEVKIKP